MQPRARLLDVPGTAAAEEALRPFPASALRLVGRPRRLGREGGAV